ncbi:MAG: Clp protease N-terminal domain-containing protein [Chthoniobacter sp.]
MMNNFTPRAQQVLALARKEADRFNHNYVGTEHLLLGLIKLGQVSRSMSSRKWDSTSRPCAWKSKSKSAAAPKPRWWATSPTRRA